MSILRGQADVSAIVPMPTDRIDDASTVTNVSAETVTWFYVTSSAWASATGQDAGTIVWGKLVFDGILNSNKATVGSFNNTSLSLGATTRLDVRVSIPEEVLSAIQFMSPTDQKAEVAKYLTVYGYYAIDHRRGQLWGRPKATVADDTASYSYKAPIAGGAGPASTVVDQSTGTTASGTTAADTTAGGTTIRAANTKRRFTQCQNNGAADVYFGAGTVTSSFLKVVPGGTFTWYSPEALKVLSSSGSCNIAFTDYINS